MAGAVGTNYREGWPWWLLCLWQHAEFQVQIMTSYILSACHWLELRKNNNNFSTSGPLDWNSELYRGGKHSHSKVFLIQHTVSQVCAHACGGSYVSGTFINNLNWQSNFNTQWEVLSFKDCGSSIFHLVKTLTHQSQSLRIQTAWEKWIWVR